MQTITLHQTRSINSGEKEKHVMLHVIIINNRESIGKHIVSLRFDFCVNGILSPVSIRLYFLQTALRDSLGCLSSSPCPVPETGLIRVSHPPHKVWRHPQKFFCLLLNLSKAGHRRWSLRELFQEGVVTEVFSLEVGGSRSEVMKCSWQCSWRSSGQLSGPFCLETPHFHAWAITLFRIVRATFVWTLPFPIFCVPDKGSLQWNI